jgi:hypothetical protein
MQAEHRREHVDDDIEHRGAIVLGGVVVEAGRLLVDGVAQGAAVLDRVAGPAVPATTVAAAQAAVTRANARTSTASRERPSALVPHEVPLRALRSFHRKIGEPDRTTASIDIS